MRRRPPNSTLPQTDRFFDLDARDAMGRARRPTGSGRESSSHTKHAACLACTGSLHGRRAPLRPYRPPPSPLSLSSPLPLLRLLLLLPPLPGIATRDAGAASVPENDRVDHRPWTRTQTQTRRWSRTRRKGTRKQRADRIPSPLQAHTRGAQSWTRPGRGRSPRRRATANDAGTRRVRDTARPRSRPTTPDRRARRVGIPRTRLRPRPPVRQNRAGGPRRDESLESTPPQLRPRAPRGRPHPSWTTGPEKQPLRTPLPLR